MPAVSFAATKEELLLISRIVSRGAQMARDHGTPIRDRVSAHMDITACHVNGCPLKLQELLDAGDSDFGHDFFGIRRHIDRETGQLKDYFLPRFAAPRNTP